MVNNRKIIISCDLFWGFTKLIDLDEVESIDEIVNTILHELNLFLNEHNLLNLVEKLNTTIKNNKYHIHGATFEDILISNPEETIYICSH
jgi:hypothetical protein